MPQADFPPRAVTGAVALPPNQSKARSVCMTRARAIGMLLGATWVGLLAGAACGGSSSSTPNRHDNAGAGQVAAEPAGAAGQPAGGQATQDPGSGAGDGGAPAPSGIGGMSDGGAAGAPGGAAGAPEEPVVPPTNQSIGAACTSSANCRAGLTCITETSAALNGGAPPHGLCTATCTSDDDCSAVTPGSTCYPFDSNAASGYCVEGCKFGQQGLFRKCHARPEFSCMVAFLQDTGVACSSGCFDDEICSNDTCQQALPACLPACRGDLDCAKGLYCDQSFLGGTCVPNKPIGKLLGEPCTVPGPLEQDEPDGCVGFCQADVTGGSEGHCWATCGLGGGCAWNAATKRFDGACQYFSTLPIASANGDFGFCAPSCNCAAECNSPDLACFAAKVVGPLDPAVYHGPGLCFDAALTGEPVVEQCQ